MSVVTIQIFVDAVYLLCGGEQAKAVFVVDDSAAGSIDRGTDRAQTAVHPGQLVRWMLYPIDVQTPIWLKGVHFSVPTEVDAVEDEAAGGAEPPVTEPVASASDSPAEAGKAADDPVAPPLIAPWWLRWEGYMPALLPPGGAAPYTVEVAFGGAGTRTMRITGPALIAPATFEPAPPPAGAIL